MTLGGCLTLCASLLTGAAIGADDDVGTTASQSTSDKDALMKQYRQLTRDAFQLSTDSTTVEDYTAIIDLCDKAIELHVKDASYAKSLASWAYNQRGQARLEGESPSSDSSLEDDAELQKQAIADFDEALRLDPENWRAFHNRGLSHAQTGDDTHAIHDLDKAISLQPESAKAKYNRAELRYSRGEYRMAIVDYSRAVDLDPADPCAYTGLAHCYYQMQRFDDALNNYDIAIRFVKQDAQALANRADAYQKVGRWERAWSDYRSALELDQSNGQTYRDVAWLLATCPDPRHQNAELAEQAAAKALEILGDQDVRAWDALAAAKARAGEFKEASQAVSKAIKHAGGDDTAPLEARLALYNDQQAFTQGDSVQR